MKTVSIITPSYFPRQKFLLLLAECISKQDYPNILEWIIIDSSLKSYDLESSQTLASFIEELRSKNLPEIIYHISSKSKIGGWRNDGLKLSRGDIIVYMDDDDYYFPERVSHTVEVLSKSPYKMAGCNNIYFYDVFFKKCFYFNGFDEMGGRHSINNCIGFQREWMLDHSYDENVHHCEEISITNNFELQMAQLDPLKTILHFSHDLNTFNKRRLIFERAINGDKYYVQLEKNLDSFIVDEELCNKYKKLFESMLEQKECLYDIIYFCGLSAPWVPHREDLGGSEQGIKFLSEEFVQKGMKVAVYGTFGMDDHTNGQMQGTKADFTLNGVDYYSYYKFRFWDRFRNVILWRQGGYVLYEMFKENILVDNLIVDFHDNDINLYSKVLLNNAVSKIMFKSEFHKNFLAQMSGKDDERVVVIPNGIRVKEFQSEIVPKRNPYRFCYCSCYTRGLVRILKDIWPRIYEMEPRAELHVYYGMDLVSDSKLKNQIQLLLSSPGVMDHQRQPLRIIAREKKLSRFHLYYTDSLAEIDCISLRESLVAGCIPIIANEHLFKFIDGIRLKWLPNTLAFNMEIANAIVQLIELPEDQLDSLSKYYMQSPMITTWEDTANKWMEWMEWME